MSPDSFALAQKRLDQIIRFVIPAALLLLVWLVLTNILQGFGQIDSLRFNSHEIAGLRLTNALGLMQGRLPYPSLDSGTLLTPIYGPVGFCFYLPAAMAS